VQVPCHDGTIWSYGSTGSFVDVHVHLTGGVHYVMQVRAATEIGSTSGWGSASLPVLAPPDVPVRPEAPSCHHHGHTSVGISWPETWSSGLDVHRCRFRFATNENMAHAAEASHEETRANLTERTAVVSGLQLDECYHFQVSVQNIVGWSKWSEPSEGIFTQACRPDAPAMPRLETAEAHCLTISWLPPHDGGTKIETYETVLLQEDGEQHSRAFVCLLGKINCLRAIEAEEVLEQHGLLTRWETLQADSSAVPHCHSFTGLEGSMDYAIAIRAINSAGISDWSPVLARLHTPPSVPDRCPQVALIAACPTSLHCKIHLPHHNGAPIESLDLLWRYATGPVDRYLAMGKQLPAGNRRLGIPHGLVTAQVVDQQATYMNMTLDGLRPGCAYNVQARARNSCGFGEASAMVQLECAPTQPDAPVAVRPATEEEAQLCFVDMSTSANLECSETLSAVGGLSPAAGTDTDTLLFGDDLRSEFR